MFARTMSKMVRLLAPERALILLVSEAGQLEVEAAHGLAPETVFTDAPLSLSLFERVRATGRPLLAADLREDPAFGDISSLLLSDIRSLVCVPVLAPGGEVRALLYADRRASLAAFTPTHEAQLLNLAGQLERRLYPGAVPRRPAPARPPPPPGIGLSTRSQVLLMRSLATLVRAGISLARSLQLLSESGEDPRADELCRRLEQEIRTGSTLSASMQRAWSSLSAFHLRLVEVAERTGSLVEVLDHLASYEERRHQQTLRLRSALTYPLFLFSASMAMLVALPPMLLRGQFHALAEPPALTRWMMAAGAMLASPWTLLVLAALLAAVGLSARRLSRSPRAMLWLQHRALGLPIFGPSLRILATTRFAQALALEMQVGLPVQEAVQLAAEVSADPVLEASIPHSVACLLEGRHLADSLQECGYFPAKFLMALAAGEEAGKVPATLLWLARLYQQELEATVERGAAAMEPTMMLLMGVVGGLMAVATMLPMVGLLQNL